MAVLCTAAQWWGGVPGHCGVALRNELTFAVPALALAAGGAGADIHPCRLLGARSRHTPTVSWLEVAYSGADKRSSVSAEDAVTGDWNLVLRFERSGFAQWTTLATKQTTTQLLLAILPAMSAVLAVMGIAFKYVVEPASNKCAWRGDSSLADTKKAAASEI